VAHDDLNLDAVTPTAEDWGNIHAKAWKDAQFRHLLETDPTKAVTQYGAQIGKKYERIVIVAPAPNPAKIPEELWPLLLQAPPACC
jgi:hypothetical protein